MAQPRPLLMPWLRARIDSQQFPGVSWTNAERTEFSIPWKHALRQDSSDTDILIFRAWAEVSGNGRAVGDPSVWKRNFRSALRVKGFKMTQDNKNDTANPHKIFRWPDETAPTANSSSPDQPSPVVFEEYPHPTQETQPPLEMIFTVFSANSSSPNQPSPVMFEDYLLPTQETQQPMQIIFPHDVYSVPADSHDILQECLNGLNIAAETESCEPPPEQQLRVEGDVIGAPVLRGQPQYPLGCEGAVHGAGLPGQPAQPMEGAGGGAYDQQRAEQFLHTVTQTADGSRFMTNFNVKVFYRGRLVSEQLVKNESGVRLVYRPHLLGPPGVDPPVDPDSGLSLVSLPGIESIRNRTQAELTQRILDSLGSLDVCASGHAVYGQRRGETRAYWSFSNFDQSRRPQEVSKQPEQLYEFKDFLKGMLGFISGQSKHSPPSSLFFCLGEKWPDPENNPWTKKLIMVEVVLTSIELLNNMAVEGGASSLQSVELQMSLEEMMEMC